MIKTVDDSKQYIVPQVDISSRELLNKVTYRDEKENIKLDPKKFTKIFKVITRTKYFKGHFMAYDYETGITEGLDDIEIERLIKYILDKMDKKLWNLKLEYTIKEILKREVDILTQIPKYSNYVFLENGIYNIGTRKLEKFTPNFIIVNKIRTKYNQEATCPEFLNFINQAMMGDKELIMVIQEMIGYCLVDCSNAQKFFLLYGVGSNGKSVLGDVIRNVLGDENVSSVSVNQMKDNFVVSSIDGKKANISSENEANFETEKIKAISSGDVITFDIKYKMPYEYRPTCKLIFISNTLPNTYDNSLGFYRRLMIIPFNNIVKPEQKDINLTQKLIQEKEGILLWALEGLNRLVSNNYNFTKSEIMKKMLKEYKDSQDPVHMFVKENLKSEKDSRINKRELIEKYLNWAITNSIDTKGTDSNSKFWKELRRVTAMEGMVIEERKSKNSRYIKHLGWVA